MTTQEKVEKKGWKVKFVYGWVDGEQKIKSVIATKRAMKLTAKTITGIYSQLI